MLIRSPLWDVIFLPGIAFRTIYQAKFRILVLTHGDVISKRALQHQIALAEDLSQKNSRGQFFPAAIFVVNLQNVDKQKQLKDLIDAMYGAFYLNNMKQRGFVVSGIPNVGKSSLILPLTKGRTLAVKKKKHYHLPKVGPVAGLTLGIKAHVLRCPDYNNEISLYDTPGLRRRAMDCDTPVLKDLVASNSTMYRKTYHAVCTQEDCMAVVLRALNRHADITQDIPKYVSMLGLKDRTDDVKVFLDAVGRKVPIPELIRKCNQGEYGGVIFTGHGSLNIDRVNPKELVLGSPIVYRNDFAKTLADYGKDPTLMLTDPRLEGYRTQNASEKSHSQLGLEKRQRQIESIESDWDF